MKRQQETYLTKFLYRIQTLFLCQKHTAVGLTWQDHLLSAPHCGCLKNTELGRSGLCWGHTNTIALAPSCFLSLRCCLAIWMELSQEWDRLETVQTGWAKYNCLKQKGVCSFVLKRSWFQLGFGNHWKDDNTQNMRTEMCSATWWMVKSYLTQSRCSKCLNIHLSPFEHNYRHNISY